MHSGGGDEQQGTMKIQQQGTVYTPFVDLEPGKTTNKIVKVLVLKMWKFENKSTGKVWGLEIHLMDHEGNQIHAKVGKDYVELFPGMMKDVCILFEDLDLNCQQLVTASFF
ncbi:uncharacterized protein LOC113342315 [Papaver somniferum]|uniref:uncharacterized protein LOC113342315 n=1 Tax=Papaver somniferum TaxID=3469 RepID=UPI000E6FCEAE|nr:uncharacterized protein LOC113342315 [Papaver somniferum]